MNRVTVVFGSDHAGFALKENLKAHLVNNGFLDGATQIPALLVVVDCPDIPCDICIIMTKKLTINCILAVIISN